MELGIRIGDWEWRLGLGIGNLDLGLGMGIRFEIGDQDVWDLGWEKNWVWQLRLEIWD